MLNKWDSERQLQDTCTIERRDGTHRDSYISPDTVDRTTVYFLYKTMADILNIIETNILLL